MDFSSSKPPVTTDTPARQPVSLGDPGWLLQAHFSESPALLPDSLSFSQLVEGEQGGEGKQYREVGKDLDSEKEQTTVQILALSLI